MWCSAADNAQFSVVSVAIKVLRDRGGVRLEVRRGRICLAPYMKYTNRDIDMSMIQWSRNGGNRGANYDIVSYVDRFCTAAAVNAQVSQPEVGVEHRQHLTALELETIDYDVSRHMVRRQAVAGHGYPRQAT